MTPLALAKLIGVQDLGPEIPDFVLPAVQELINDCWAIDAEKRPSFHEIVKRLEGIDFAVTDGVNGAKVAGFVREIRDWETAHGLTEQWE